MEPQSPLSRRWGRHPGSGASRTAGGAGTVGGGGRVKEHAFALQGVFDGSANPGTGVDVPFGAQAGEGGVDVGRDTDQ